MCLRSTHDAKGYVANEAQVHLYVYLYQVRFKQAVNLYILYHLVHLHKDATVIVSVGKCPRSDGSFSFLLWVTFAPTCVYYAKPD